MKPLRAIVILLVLANLLLFARGQFGDFEEGREPKRLASQLSPEKLRLVSPATPPVAPQACRLLTGLNPEELLLLKAEVGEKAPGLELVVKSGQESPDYGVLIAHLPNRQAAEKKLSELKRLGVTDAILMQEEDPGRFAISLGLFNSEPAAQEHLKSLAKHGVRSAEVLPRRKHQQWLARGPADLLGKRLPELLAVFPGAGISECPADH